MKHSLSCFAAASVAILVTAGVTFFFAGSGSSAFANTGSESQLQAKEAPATVQPVALASAYAKPASVLPASALKLTPETSVKAATGKGEVTVKPVSGEVSPTITAVPKIPAPANIAKDNTFSRRNPVVEAVNKTKNAIVMVRVPRANAKDMIGTGVIVDQHGFIITNKHVVADAKTVIVVLADDTRIQADVVVGEARYDLAILRIRTTRQLSVLPLAPVDDLMVGESVIAVGHPFGYSHSVSTGVIAALNREITMPTGDVLTALIQTNASINPGNSGGPLLNINGEFIGINVALREGAQNIAFSINAGTVKAFLRKHLSSAHVSGIQHGLQCSEKTTAETGKRQKVVVSWFQGEGVLCKGDELVSIGNKQVNNTFDLERAFWGRKPGESVSLKIVRQGQEMNVSLTVVASNGAGQTTASLPRAVSQPAGTPVTAVAANQR